MLQWKFYDKLAHTHLSPLDTLTAAATTHVHKAKVMYYYETLNSVDYKGSMTSLQSCQSGFSSISRHSTSGVSSGMSSSHSEKLPRSLVSVMDHNNGNGSGKKWRKPKHNKHVNFWWCKWLITEYATITYSAQNQKSPFKVLILMNFIKVIQILDESSEKLSNILILQRTVQIWDPVQKRKPLQTRTFCKNMTLLIIFQWWCF